MKPDTLRVVVRASGIQALFPLLSPLPCSLPSPGPKKNTPSSLCNLDGSVLPTLLYLTGSLPVPQASPDKSVLS